MSFCHHEASVVRRCRPSVNFSHFNLLLGSIYIGSFIKFVHFVSIGRQTWLPWAILNSDWLNFQKSSLKPLGQMEPNLTGNIYGRSCMNCVHFVPIGRQTWPLWAVLNSDWPSLQTSSPLKPLGQMEPNLTESIYRRSFMNLFILPRSDDKHGRN